MNINTEDKYEIKLTLSFMDNIEINYVVRWSYK